VNARMDFYVFVSNNAEFCGALIGRTESDDPQTLHINSLAMDMIVQTDTEDVSLYSFGVIGWSESNVLISNMAIDIQIAQCNGTNVGIIGYQRAS